MSPHTAKAAGRLAPGSRGFIILLGMMAALPSFGIDMSLPALGPLAAALGVSAARAGLVMSAFMAGFAIAPPVCGPVSDRIGRKPVLLAALTLFAAASLGDAVSHRLSQLLAWRLAQGMGAGVGMTMTLAITRDVFDGAAGQAMLSRIVNLMMVVPMLAPGVGSVLLLLGSWRWIFATLSLIGTLLLGLAWGRLVESGTRRVPVSGRAGLFDGYVAVLADPACLGYLLVNATGFGALFAYVSASSLFFVDALGLTRLQYSLVFAVTSFGILLGANASGRLARRGAGAGMLLGAGVALAVAAASLLLAAEVAGWLWVPGLVGLLVLFTTAFGLIAPNATFAAMQPLPDHAGAVSAMLGSSQVLAGAVSSAAAMLLGGRHPGLSMAATMLAWSSLALLLKLALPQGRAEERPRLCPGSAEA